MRTLKVGDLTARYRERVKKNHETYKMLYKQCIDHIKRRNEMGATSSTYFVSEIVVGRPLFTHSHAIRYIQEKLERGKFHVEVDPVSKHLTIDWGQEKEKQIRKKAPEDLGIDMKRYREQRRKRAKKEQNAQRVDHWVSESSIATGSKKKAKDKKKKAMPITEPLSMRISRLNAALSLNKK